MLNFAKLYDHAFLNLSYREKSNYIGATFQGRMCDKHYGGGVALVWYDLIYLAKMYKWDAI